ncbi:SAM-dependent methyltransferase [Lentzea tibetensis]|uniref:SAM-dependent methyltransferase n=1 Tax=Lentzea tibetensis TaxID=2591470 RepID=A0A563EJ60_9PSEU|nr:class I SAM-dependent methyltransferase [Lentzea tibetensis]TWP46671.1 SAM-dependent methyltransferase [Lentzea tibetensis]
MAGQLELTPDLLGYVRDVSLREHPVLAELGEETAGLPGGTTMRVMAEEGQLLAMLALLIDARSVVEVGTFTGYGTLCLALAVPADGQVVTCDITNRWPLVGVPHWERAGVADRIDLRIGDAADTMTELLKERGPGTVDLVFIDADKVSYRRYYELALELLRPGGLAVVDNTLFSGRVTDSSVEDPDTLAIREFNAFLRDDDRVDLSMIVMADGITLARKRF